ncbi:MAG: flagellar export protein FliJ [bacterium]
MAREQRPGKFKYTLETVLRVRGIKERRESEKFAEKQREYLTEKQKEEQLEEEKKEKEGELKHIIKKGPISQFEKVLRRHAHLGVLRKDIDEQIEKVIDASKRLEGQRAKLIESMKERKIIEKDKGHRLDDYEKMMKNLEIKFLDEIATQRFKRGL